MPSVLAKIDEHQGQKSEEEQTEDNHSHLDLEHPWPHELDPQKKSPALTSLSSLEGLQDVVWLIYENDRVLLEVAAHQEADWIINMINCVSRCSAFRRHISSIFPARYIIQGGPFNYDSHRRSVQTPVVTIIHYV